MLKYFSKMFMVCVMLMLSSLAMAGTWSAPSVDHSVQVTNTMNLPSVAGTSSTSQASGSCTTGQTFYYYNTSAWLCRFNACRGLLTVYRQTCQ